MICLEGNILDADMRFIAVYLAELGLKYSVVYVHEPLFYKVCMTIDDNEDKQMVKLHGWYAILEYLIENFECNIGRGNMLSKQDLQGFERDDLYRNREQLQLYRSEFWEEIVLPIMQERAYRFMYKIEAKGYQFLLKLRAKNVIFLIKNDQKLLKNDYFLNNFLQIIDLYIASIVSCLDYLGEIKWSNFDCLYNWYVRVKSRESFGVVLRESVAYMPPPVHYGLIDWEQGCMG